MFCWFVFLFSVRRALGPDLPVGDEWVRGWGSCNPHCPAKNGSGKPPPIPCLLSACSSWVRRGPSPLSHHTPSTALQSGHQVVAHPGPVTDTSCLVYSTHRLCRGSARLGPTWCVHPTHLPPAGRLEAMQQQEMEGERQKPSFPYACHPICNCICCFKKPFQTHDKFIELENWTALRTRRSILTNTGVTCRIHTGGLPDPWIPPLDLEFG